MWKYQCKNQFISLVVSFLAGMALTAFFYYTTGSDTLSDALSAQVMELLNQTGDWVLIVSGGFAFAGIVNVIILAQIIMNRFHMSSFLIFMICIFAYQYVYMLGVIAVIPMLVITLYGWLSLRAQDRSLLRARNISDDEELVRMYKIHHPLDEKVRQMAENCARTMQRVTWIYTLGVVAVFAVVFMVDNAIVVMLAVLFYMITLNFLLRYRSSCVSPISSLLYNDCNPSACASAIIYFSTRHGKVKLKMQSLFAQCCIYLDDPHLAQDVLITYPRKDPTSSLTYWALMAYIDYLLKDEDGLYRCKEEASRINMRFGSTGVMIRNEEIAAIDNKIHLMNSDFNECKKYYLNQYNKCRLNYEKMDAAYYIALISFVQQEYPVAKVYFEKVVQKAGTMYFRAKAQTYLQKLDGMQLEESY